LRDLLAEVVAAIGVDAGAVYRVDVDRADLVRASATAPPPEFDAVVRPGDGIVGEALASRVTRVVSGAGSGSDPAGYASIRGLRWAAVQPLVHDDRVLGALVVGRRAGHPDPDGDLAALDALAGIVAPILAAAELAALDGALRRRVEQLTLAVRELAHDLNNDLTMPIGALELLRDRDDLPPDVLELLAASADDLARVEARVRAFQHVARGAR
jgi:GAF domain-containing protein